MQIETQKHAFSTSLALSYYLPQTKAIQAIKCNLQAKAFNQQGPT